LSDTSWRFYPISSPRAFEEVVDQITFAIRSGAFRPGQRLPLVEELSETMGVSRPTIGEAIRVLSQAGVLVSQRGAAGGVTVVSDNIPDTMIMRQPSGWREAAQRELIEARRPIEMKLALLAGERATADDFAAMRYAITQLSADPRADRLRRINYDHLFHYAMGRAARSELLAYYQHQVLEQLYFGVRDVVDDEKHVQSIAELHEETLEALESRVPARIEAAMDRHLRWMEDKVAEGRRKTRAGAGAGDDRRRAPGATTARARLIERRRGVPRRDPS
jgi:DNA-binding FadR family transcriptional regulator